MNQIMKQSRTALRIVLALAGILGTVPFPASAQTGDTARIYGSVHDSTSGAIANAEVVARNLNTGVVRKTVSTESGDFVIANLPTGAYKVTITQTGFKAYSQEGIQLQVDREAQVNAVLEVGEAKQSVTVSAEAPVLEARVSTLTDLVDEKRMAELPLNGRNALQLTLLVPGVQSTPTTSIITGSTRPDQQVISTGGARGNTVVYNLDGLSNSDNYTNVANVYPNPDALQEFSFQTNNFSAEYGRRTGGVVNAITRSGTNAFHGSLFEFVRNDFFNATNFFTPGASDGVKRNQYGASVGGPIRRDRTFLFASWQGTNLRQHPPGVSAIVPTPAQRTGDFSKLLNSKGGLIVINDPSTSQPFPNNQISTARFDPVAAKVLQWLPTPTDSTGLVQVPVYSLYDDNQFVVKMDHTLNDSTRVTARYLYDKLVSGNTVLPTDLLGASRSPDFGSHNALLSVLHTFSPTVIVVASAGWNRLQSSFTRGFPQTLAELGAHLFDMSLNKDVEMTVGSFFSFPTSTGLQGGILTRNDFQYQASLTWVAGKHELKFGTDILRQQLNMPGLPFNSDGNFTFTNSRTGSNLSDFFLGQGTSFTQGSPQAEALRGFSPGFYVQDNYRIMKKLSLNLGLRYAPFFPWIDARNNEVAVWRLGQQSQRAPGLPPNLLVVGDPTVPKAGYEGSLKRFEPRLGFAYQLDSKTAVRGGFGIFYEFPNSIVNNRITLAAPFAVNVTIQNPNSIVNPWTAAQPNPFPTLIPPPSSYSFPKPLTSVVYADNFTNSHADQWNLTLERQFGGSWVARLSYMGTRARDLLANREINPGILGPGASTANVNQRRAYYPNYGSVTRFESTGISDYNALAFTVEKRFSRGLSLLASYTFSKSTDVASSLAAGGAGAVYTNPAVPGYDHALSDFDRRHRFVASFLYALPKLAKMSAPVRAVIGGWQANGIVTMQAGNPVNVLDGTDQSLDGVAQDRPNLVGDPNLDSGRSKAAKVAQYFNTAAFQLNPAGTFGTAGRNVLRGPGLGNVDASVFKSFALHEAWTLQFRAEAFNVFNHANLDNPIVTLNSSLFGHVTTAEPPRIMQFGFRITF